MLRTLVIQVSGNQAEALRKYLVRGDGRHGDPDWAWGHLGAVICREHGEMLMAQLADQPLVTDGATGRLVAEASTGGEEQQS